MSFFKDICNQIAKRLRNLIYREKIITGNVTESVSALPPELIVFIANKLPVKSLVQLAQVNKETYTILSQVPYKIKDRPEVYKLHTLGFPYYNALLFNRKRENFYESVKPWFKLDLDGCNPGLVLSALSISGAICILVLALLTTYNNTKLLSTNSMAGALFGGFFMGVGSLVTPTLFLIGTGRFADYIYSKIENKISEIRDEHVIHFKALNYRINNDDINIDFKRGI